MGTLEKCWNNRAPPKAGFIAKDRLLLSCDYWVEIEIWIPNRWIDEAKKCQQPGKGFKPLQGCVGCAHLQSD